MTGSQTVRVAAVDLNGQFRGKRLPAAQAGKTVRMPLSVLNVDIFGADIEGSPLVFESGDQDGSLVPWDRDPVPLPWLDSDPMLHPMMMEDQSGAPFAGDPRQALVRVLDSFAAKGWQVAAAVELEFFLVDHDGGLAAPRNPKTGRRLNGQEILSLREIDSFDALFNEIERGARAMGLPGHVVTSEAGIGQFEVTLGHGPALRAADDALLMKELIKGCARNHGLAATFMAKPFAQESGNGLHLHASILDGAGRNILDDGTDHGSEALRQAIAGCLAAMPASTLIFAPHHNSYRRFVDGAHAPTSAAWGYENRTVALRVPGGPPAARRFEHRVAGGDTNPYLVFAAILGAALYGIEDRLAPPAPITGSAYGADGPQLAPSWQAAIEATRDPVLDAIFPGMLLDNLRATKIQELAQCAKLTESELLLSLLEAV